MLLGDSKTVASAGGWTSTLTDALSVASGFQWSNVNRAVSGAAVMYPIGVVSAQMGSSVLLNPVPAGYTIPAVVINYGANDLYYPNGYGGGPGGIAYLNETAWKAAYLALIDAIHAKWPTAQVYLTKPWTRLYAADCDTLAGWIDDIVAARPGVAFVGDDERVWLENGDDGAARTTDGVHYNAAGHAEKAAQMLTVMGY